MTLKIPIHPLTLRFHDELERVLFNSYFQKSLIQVRFALLLAVFFDAIYVVLDEGISDKYLFQERGVIHVKGKGEMLTYLLTGRKVRQPLPSNQRL